MKKPSKVERKRAEELQISVGELRLLELLEELNQRLRWAQILAFGTQYVLQWKEVVSKEELDTVLQAVTRTLDQDGTESERSRRIAELRALIEERNQEAAHGVKIIAKERRRRGKRKKRPQTKPEKDAADAKAPEKAPAPNKAPAPPSPGALDRDISNL